MAIRWILYFLCPVLVLCVNTSRADTIEARLAKIEDELSTHQENYQRLQKINFKLEQELITYKESAAVLEKKIDDQAKAIDQLQKSHFNGNNVTSRSIITDFSAETVAFTAFMDADAHNLGINQPVPFNNVLTNIGGGYHNMTHIFTCPVSGVYLFSFAIAESTAHEICARLVIDGQNVVDAIADPFHDNQDMQATNVAVLQVNKGQTVWVANYYHGSSYYRSENNFRYCTFSGVLIQAL